MKIRAVTVIHSQLFQSIRQQNVFNWLAHISCVRMTDALRCHQTILQPVLMIGTLISTWSIIWPGCMRVIYPNYYIILITCR